MNSRDTNYTQELAAHLFQLLTVKHNHHDGKQWSLVDEIPEKFLSNGKLELEGIDFTLFGYQIHDINFKNCSFNRCKFTSQILKNCNFNDCTFTDTRFDACHVDKKTGVSLPEAVSEKLVNYNDEISWASYGIRIHENTIPCDDLVKSANDWLSAFLETNKQTIESHLPFMAMSTSQEDDLSKYVLNLIKPLNSQYDTIVMPPSDGFYSFKPLTNNMPEKYYRGWKLHISVDKEKVKQAFNCIAHILLDNDDICNFKFLDLSIDESRRGERLSNGGQFTVYLYQDGLQPMVSNDKLKSMLQQITEQLQSADIKPGEIPESDGKTCFPYVSLRNDGDFVFQYYPASDSGRNYNPYNIPCVFDFLLLENKAFDVGQHFTSFNLNTQDQIERALTATLIALINVSLKPEHVCRVMHDIILSNIGISNSGNQFEMLAGKNDFLLKFAREQASECDAILLLMLLNITKDIFKRYNAGSQMIAVIKFLDDLNKPLFKLNVGMFDVFPYAIRQYILNNADRNLLINVSKLVKLIPSLYKVNHEHDSTYDSVIRFRDNDEDEQFNKYCSSRSELFKQFLQKNKYNIRSFMQGGVLSYDQLQMLDEEKQALLMAHPDQTVMLLQSDVNIKAINETRLEILCGVLNDFSNVKKLCKTGGLSLLEFLNFDNKLLILMLSKPREIQAILVCFGVKLGEFTQLPTSKMNMLLEQGEYNYAKSCISVSFNKLMSYQDDFIRDVIESSNLDGDYLNDVIIEQLSQQPVEIRKSCLAQHSGALNIMLTDYSLSFEQIYHLSKIKNAYSSLIDSLNVILHTCGINLVKFIGMAEDVQTILLNNANSIAVLLQHYSISLTDILSNTNTRKLDILEYSRELLSMAKELKINYSNILNALNVIEQHNKMDFSNAGDFVKQIKLLMRHGVSFEKIFTLNDSDFNKLKYASYSYGRSGFLSSQSSSEDDCVDKFIDDHFKVITNGNDLASFQLK